MGENGLIKYEEDVEETQTEIIENYETDVATSVSNSDPILYIPSVSKGDLVEMQREIVSALSSETLWEKSISEYSVQEGLLLFIFILLLWLVISRFFGGIFK